MNISCLIVEDEPNAGKLIKKYVEQIPLLQLKGICKNAEEALAFLTTQSVDLAFLDINLPGISGMKLADTLLSQNIIFTTAYSKYAVESYAADAIDYLLKPISFDRFYKAVMKAKQIIEYQQGPSSTNLFGNDLIFIRSGKKIIGVDYSQIRYIEGLKEYAIIMTSTGKHIIYKRMKDLEKSLPDSFIRVHNSFIVNLFSISKIEDNQILIAEKQIPISQKYKQPLLERINERML